MSTRIALVPFVLAAAFAAPASAQTQTREPGRIGVAAKAGVVFPQVTTELDTGWVAEIDGSFRLFGRISVFGSIGYTQPRVQRSSVSDPRVNGGSYDGAQTQRELILSAGAVHRFAPPPAKWNAYAGLGLRAYLLQTVTAGDAAGNDFGENEEQSTRIGLVAIGGAEARVGPGAVVGELQLGGSSLPHLITGDVSTFALVLQLGYRLSL